MTAYLQFLCNQVTKWEMNRLPIWCLLFLLSVWSGCGGSSVGNTVGSQEEEISGGLNVKIETDHTTISPGETIDLAVKFDPPANTQVRIAWINVTGYGKL